MTLIVSLSLTHTHTLNDLYDEDTEQNTNSHTQTRIYMFICRHENQDKTKRLAFQSGCKLTFVGFSGWSALFFYLLMKVFLVN